jgi:ell wall binding domain 2 (CWB2)
VPRAPLLLLLIAALAVPLSACGSGGEEAPPQFGDEEGAQSGGGGLANFAAVSVATRNTTRLGGADSPTDAAAVASAVFPATSSDNRPNAVVLADRDDWRGAVAAAALSGRPVSAPILLSEDGNLPEVTRSALNRLKPKGSDLARDSQVIRVGSGPPAPDGLRSIQLGGTDPYATAAEVDRLASAVRGDPSGDVVVVSGEEASYGYAMPAAAWAARSGDAVLLTQRDRLPAPTARALREHERPNIYLLGPESVISTRVERELRRLGRVRRMGAEGVVENAVEFARFRGRGFGWGIRVPGFNFTVASARRPGDAAAAAALGSNGIFAPLLLNDAPRAALAQPLESYLLDVQPGFEEDPRTGVYNHIWILGDATALSASAQGRLDEIAALVPVEVGPP